MKQLFPSGCGARWCAAGVLTVATLIAPVLARAQTTVRVAVAGVPSDMDKLAYAVAMAKGYFKEEGVDIKSIDMFSGAKALQALVGGSVDVVEGAFEHTLRMKAQGLDLTCVAIFDKVPGNVLMVVKSQEQKIKGPADLKGTRIGVTSPGSSTNFFAIQYMRQGGLAAKDASYIGIGAGGSAMAAVRTGKQLDALVNTDPLVTELVHSGDVSVLVDGRTEAGTKTVYGGLYPFGCLYARADYVKRNPQIAQALANAITHTMKWMQTSSVEQIAAIMPKTYYSDRKLYEEMLSKNVESIRWDGIMTPEMVQTVLKVLALSDPKLKGIDPTGTFDNELTRRALQKYH